NCQFRGKHFKKYFRLEGQPMVLRCPQARSWLQTSASPQLNMTWHKNDSGRKVSGEETRMVQDWALRVFPTLQRDSVTNVCTVRNDLDVIQTVRLQIVSSSLSLKYLPPQLLGRVDLISCEPWNNFFMSHVTNKRFQLCLGSVLLSQDNEKLLSLKVTTYLLINNMSADTGSYRCWTFSHKGTRYNITRSIQQQKKKGVEPILVIVFPPDHISLAGGSRLTMACKVLLSQKTSSPMVWCKANDTSIESAYPGGQIPVTLQMEYSKTNESAIGFSDPFRREDLNTDFTCAVDNTFTYETLHITNKEETSTFSWEIAPAPLLLVFLVLGGICVQRWCKHRPGKGYSLTTMKTSYEDF
uniref:Ig-like domain-containing protein n=1 Tax=Loxodonta africana TaxID=9785 RepID=G3TNV6_LOXAF